MNIKRFALCTFIGFFFVFGYEFIVHGMLLLPFYDQTPQLWRPMEEYQSFIPFMTIMQLLTTTALCYIYTRHHEGKGMREGLRFGIMFGVLLGLLQMGSFAWMPISFILAALWFITTLVQTICLGLIFSRLYKA